MKIKMTSVVVPDPNEALKFYTEILGFKEFMHIPEAKIAIVVSKEDPDGVALMLESNENPASKRFQKEISEQNIPFIVFGSDDVWKEYDRLEKLGVKFTKKPVTSEWGTTAVFEDTCGNLIQIHQDKVG